MTLLSHTTCLPTLSGRFNLAFLNVHTVSVTPHCFPGKVADKMWRERGINVNKSGAWCERTSHRQVSRAIQDEWERFLAGDNPTNAAAYDLMYAQAQKSGYQVFLLR